MHIAITTLPGYTPQEKKLLAQRLKEAAANLMGVIPCTVSVSVKDLSIENWDDFIKELPAVSYTHLTLPTILLV